MTLALALLLGVLPVVIFLAALVLLDSYKLVQRSDVAASIGGGAAAAGVAFGLHTLLLGTLGLDEAALRPWVAPGVEETLKAAILFVLIRRQRVGFLVDAAIHGFAVGTGFALVENAYYAGVTRDPALGLWLVRGLGTAIMHGCATAVVAILAKEVTDRRESVSVRWFLPGLAVAVAVHSLYNHFFLNPLLAAGLVLIVAPLVVVAVFERSERATQAWLGEGLDRDVELLESIASGEFRHTHAGAYLESMKSRFPGPAVADMLCYLQIHLELSLRAKGLLLARAAGLPMEIDPGVRANLEEMKFLERSIGPTGKLVLLPLRRTTGRERWQLTLLGR